MPVTEMIVALSVGIFFFLGFVFLMRLLQAWMLHRTLREAISRDSAQAARLAERPSYCARGMAGRTARRPRSLEFRSAPSKALSGGRSSNAGSI